MTEKNISADEEEMIEEIAPLFNQYVMKGAVMDISSYAEEIDLNIDKLDKLLKLHFILRNENNLDPIDFMKDLENRIRRIKTTIKKEKKIITGSEIEGKIDWENTAKERANRNPVDESLFVCNMIDKNYNIQENLILKKFLTRLQKILYSEYIENMISREPLKNIWINNESEISGEGVNYRELLQKILEENIYLRRINLKDNKITNRMLNNVKKSRNPLYQESAELLLKYNKIIEEREIDKANAKQIMKNTFIKPEKTSTLFELYWAFKIIEIYHKDRDIKFNVIGEFSKKESISEWENQDFNYRMYHNRGGGLNFSFYENLNELKDILKNNDKLSSFLGRELQIMNFLKEKVKNPSDKEKSSDLLWGGKRPDILLVKREKDTDKLAKLFIGEVKYSSDYQVGRKGFKELLEYIALIGNTHSYFESCNGLFKNLEKITGGLFLKENNEFGKKLDLSKENICVVRGKNEFERFEKIIFE